MKAVIFLVVVILAISVMIWNMRKSQAKADLKRRQSIKHRKKLEKESLTPELDMKWPVIIRPANGERPPGDESVLEEPCMTEIEFEPLATPQKRATKSA